MEDMTSEAQFKELVLNAFKDLPQQQQQVADFLLDHLDEIPFLTVPTLAKRVGVSEATIVRFAQRVGYDGFSGLKTNLTTLVRDRVTAQTSIEDVFKPNGKDNLSLVVQKELANIQDLSKDIDLETFEGAANTLFASDHIFTFGFGISAHLSSLATYLLTQIGLRATTLSTRFSSPMEQMVILRENDVMLVFSFPPFSRGTIKMVEDAKQRGIKVVAVSDRLTAPISAHADYTLQVRTHNKMFTNAIGAAVTLLNALATEIAIKHGDHAVKAVAKINRILAEDEGVLKSD
ncbi:MurR/RpiR family transcriptional regulator [Acanthopleuribacter pedis]|uniref:MurR/RpiR family transcriptional regulator n=1 Tax=Acanthopleuribacter pedis TaxID=442870 RepID=A0A8J7U685_9BACT|nr:MurR/RpiR family transcriptional regulator [Acanthopleuribacter pedis]MBO1323343.1 MurR/RpiR family transcriptional regulator [Acanthopleuribacter pedis]